MLVSLNLTGLGTRATRAIAAVAAVVVVVLVVLVGAGALLGESWLPGTDLLPLLDQGDVIIDGGNTLFSETERRTPYVESKGLLYIGTGVSGA